MHENGVYAMLRKNRERACKFLDCLHRCQLKLNPKSWCDTFDLIQDSPVRGSRWRPEHTDPGCVRYGFLQQSQSLAGKGDQVILLSGGASGATTIRNRSHDNFAVIAYSPEGDYLDLLVNEIGSYDGEVLLPEADPIVLVIKAVGGTWSMSRVTQ